MAKSNLKYMIRAWKKELKLPVWQMRSRRHRHACARSWAKASIETAEPFTCQQDAEDLLYEELQDWNE